MAKYGSQKVTSQAVFAYLCLYVKKEVGHGKKSFEKRRDVSWSMIEAQLKAIRDLQATQRLQGFGQRTSVREDPMVKQMVDNFQAGMAQMKNMSRFAESLPCLDAKVYPDGRFSIQNGGLSEASSDIAAQYQKYLGDLSNKLNLRDDATMY
ncbi:TPA: hypothetical protein ACH3X1_014655 [Trebouxia sp. C0004]